MERTLEREEERAAPIVPEESANAAGDQAGGVISLSSARLVLAVSVNACLNCCGLGSVLISNTDDVERLPNRVLNRVLTNRSISPW